MVRSLLGRRTGHALTMILRSVFFLAIFTETLTVLIVLRLVIVSENDVKLSY